MLQQVEIVAGFSLRLFPVDFVQDVAVLNIDRLFQIGNELLEER